MGWSIGYDSDWDRDIGYGVPAICDHPLCRAHIDRGLAYVCGGDPYGGELGCGLYFCEDHLQYAGPEGEEVQMCSACANGQPAYEVKPDTLQWLAHKLTDESWAQWREDNSELVERMRWALVQL